VADVKVVTTLDHAKKPLVMRAHARPPDRGRAGQAPFASCAVLLANDLLGADLALAVDGVGGVVGVVTRDIADAAHELRRRPDRALDRWREPNGGNHVLHALDVGGVARDIGLFIEIDARGEMDQRVRRKFLHGLIEPPGVQDVADIIRRRTWALVQTCDFKSRSLAAGAPAPDR
jgi:hypothetical protein